MNKTKKENTNEMFVKVDVIVSELQISKPLAYKLIKEMNEELAEAGFMTISGRVPRAYYHKRFFGFMEAK